MNKDALLATLIGFGIGLLITGLLLVGPNIMHMLPSVSMPQKNTAPAPTPTPAAFAITIESPLADTIENAVELLVTGSVNGATAATVVVGGPVDEQAVVTTGGGKFAARITLTEGKNDIMVTAYNGTKQAVQTVTVFYTPESL